MDSNSFIGIGHNPDGPDLPLGLGMRLDQEPNAMQTLEKMSNDQKTEMVQYIQGAATGGDAKKRIAEVVVKLSGGQTQF